MPVWEARKLCPDLVLALSRPERYVEVHRQLLEAVGRCIPVQRVMSIDEWSCELLANERAPERVAAIVRDIKREIRTVGDTLRCSVGAAPNVMLAKVAADLQKPDGFTIIDPERLPHALHSLELTDFPGIGPRMERRLHRWGITTVKQLTALSPQQLSAVWGSKVHGWRWWYLLRGEDVPEKRTVRRTIGHGHVLPPMLRGPEQAWGVMVRLVHKAAARLRKAVHYTARVTITIRYADEDGGSWQATHAVPPCQDTFSLMKAVEAMWAARPAGNPFQLHVVFTHLTPVPCSTPSLFEHDQRMADLSHAMDKVNRACGPNSVYLGSMFGRTQNAPMRIAFTHIPDEETESVDQLRGFGW
jgi:DNA polymerase-4